MHLVLLWFATWKNGTMEYAPAWVKRDTRRFPRTLCKDGTPTAVLSCHSESNRLADEKAFCRLMRCIGEYDGTQNTVIGVQKSDQRGGAVCFIPLTTAQMIYTADDPYVSRITFSVKNIRTDAQMKDLEQRVRTRLATVHNFSPEDESAIHLNNMMEEYKNMMVVFGGINLFIWIIGLGTLLAGIVGVSNIMLVTVQERTFEFGIRKALGARPSSIIRLILTESLFITAAFGYIGMVLGVYTMELVNKILTAPGATQTGGPGTEVQDFNMFQNPTLDLSVVLSATIVLVLAGLVAGYVPARRAAQLKTIDALRHNK